jgi:hypothetical protein
MNPSQQRLRAAGVMTLAERRMGMVDMRSRSGVELVIDHLYKVTGAPSSGRQYRIHAITADRVLATEGWFRQLIPKQNTSEDPWMWSTRGERWVPRARLQWIRDVGRIPDVGEPRFRFRWGMERG